MSAFDRRTLLSGSAALLLPHAALAATQDEPSPTSHARPGATPNTRFAVNVETWWSELPFLDRLVMASELGFPAVEFWPWQEKDIGAIQDVKGDLGLEVAQFTAWGFTPGMNDPAHHARFQRTIKESCEIAKRLGCKKMTVVGGNDQPGMSRAEMHANIATALKLVAPIAVDSDVMLILEPMNVRVDHEGHCLYGSTDALAICREVDSTHVKINWDLYHMQISEGDLCRHLQEGFDQVGYVQLADNPGRHEPGTGEIHYPRVLRALKELGYEGYVGLECTPLEDELTAARRVHAADQW